ncbi:MATE family efflux transporter [Photobacterium damselae]|uniref:MATE family efflux transporter n=1 Tax=Photobacterium damselae TaxID=38293 RepID=UPI002F41A57C
MHAQHVEQSASIGKTFIRYTIPAVTAMLVSGLYQIIDGIFVGHYVGYEGLAGINMAWPIVFILSGLGLMLGMGAGSLISIARGENKQHEGPKALLSSFHLMVILALLTLALLSAFAPVMLLTQGATITTMSLGLDYIDVFTWCSLITIMASAMPMLIRNDESPAIATGLMILGALLNIAFDYIFIGHFNMALQGAAIATILAQLCVCLGGIYYFLSKHSQLKLNIEWHKVDPATMKQVVSLGSSSLVMYLYASFVVALHNYQFMQYGSSMTVGAYAIVVLALKCTLIAGISWVLLLNIFPETMIGLFNNNNSHLLAETTKGIQLHLFGLFLDGFIVLASVYFMSVNQAGKALTISVSNMLIQLPFLYLLPKWFGVDGVWMAVPLSNIALTAIVAPMVWKDIQHRSKNWNKANTLRFTHS